MTTHYFQTANELKQKGEFAEALAYYYQSIEQNPKFHWYYHNLGENLTKLGHFEDEISCYRRALILT